jgi:HEAT repeat protein
VIKLRIMTTYNHARDYNTVVRELESHSSETQALAIEVLAEKVERGAVPKLVEVLRDPARSEAVKAAAAAAMGPLGVSEAIPRLVELTDRSEAPAVRGAAHNALLRLTDAGAQVKLGDNTREQWDNWLRSRRISGVR